MRITVQQLMSAVSTTDRANAQAFVDTFNKYADTFGINTTARVVHFLAQVYGESGKLHYDEENLNYSADALVRTWPSRFTRAKAQVYARQPQKIANYVYAKRMGNGSEASGDGWKYRGRGYIQLTGKDAYRAYQNSGFCVGSLLTHPEWLSQSPGNTKSAMWFWWKKGLNDIADEDNGKDGEAVVKRITRIVNGGYNGLQNRLNYYRALKKQFV